MESKNKHNEFVNKLKSINRNILVLGKYTRAKDNIKVKCLICGNIWNPTPHKLLLGRGCPKCADESRKIKLRKSHYDFITDVHNINPDIDVISKYKNSSTYVEFKCNKCGHHWLAKPGNILSGKGCPKCAYVIVGNKNRRTHYDFISKLSNINPKVQVLSNYINNNTKLECKCLNCGHIWNAAPKTLLLGKGCPICNSSKGELKIAKFLDDNNITYVHQKTFDNLVGVGENLLSYDFYIPSKNILIEYQGIQHEKPVDFKGYGNKNAIKNFEKQKEHDRRKAEYAHNNNIKLICIWYWNFKNIESILSEYIN